MTRPLLLASLLGLSLLGCREEPTIVITFAPQDLAGVKPADLGHPPDLARTPDMAHAVAADPCKKDVDCVMVPDGCCSCTQGGKMIAVAKANAKAHSGNCDGIMCPQVMSNDPSCAAKASCIEGKCVGVAKAKEKGKSVPGPM
jgi:hypothetical protein